MQNSNEFVYNVHRLKSDDADKLCKAYYHQTKKWFNARIINVDADAQEAEVFSTISKV
jgi:hypothetical protein